MDDKTRKRKSLTEQGGNYDETKTMLRKRGKAGQKDKEIV